MRQLVRKTFCAIGIDVFEQNERHVRTVSDVPLCRGCSEIYATLRPVPEMY